jgi:outer membrane protein, heavy metal efflux system
MRTHLLRTGSALVIALTAPVAWPQGSTAPLSLDEVARLAVEHQPNLDAYTYAANAARDAAIAESKLPDPQLKFGVQNVPVTGDDAYRLDREDMTMLSIGVMQEIVRKPARAAGANRLQAESERQESERTAETRRVVRDAQLAWVDAFDASRRADLLKRMASDVAAERAVAIKRIPAGTSDTRELFQLDSMLSMTNDKRLAAENAARKAQAQLSRWIGPNGFRPVAESLPVHAFMEPAADLTTTAKLAEHPQIIALRKGEDVARFDADRARAERTPNWSWELMYGKRQENRSNMATLQFSLPLTWNQAQRQDRRFAEKVALADRARSLTIDRERELSAEFVSAIADRYTALAREREHSERLIPAAQARFETSRAGYAAGKLPLSAVWEARRGVLDAEMEHWMIRSDLLRAALRLEYLSGAQ